MCFFGTLANALNVVVLTRRDLAAAPINRLLKWLAVADVFVMMEYVPFAIYRYLVSWWRVAEGVASGTDFPTLLLVSAFIQAVIVKCRQAFIRQKKTDNMKVNDRLT